MLPHELQKNLENALERLAHLEALAILFNAIAKGSEQGLFDHAREALMRDFPDKKLRDGEITRLADVFSAAYQDGIPCADAVLQANPLLIALALGKQLDESFLSSVSREIDVQGKRFIAFRARPSLLQKDKVSPRHWFQSIWFVETTIKGKQMNVSRVDWHDGDNPACALIEFDDQVGLDMDMTGDTFIVRGLVDQEARWNSLAAALQAAQKAKAQILVLAELSITPELLKKLSAWLLEERHPFRLIAAGSYHHRAPSDELARNRMMVLDRRGVALFHHDKWFEFDAHGCERIELGNTLQLLFAPPGLLSFAICKDFCEADGFPWKDLALDGLCVASMGDKSTMTAHHAAARTMKLIGARVLLANNTKESDGAQRGFFSLPAADPQVNSGNVSLWTWNGEKPLRGSPHLKVIK